MEPGFRKIIHPPSGNIAEVPESSLGQHYRAGWAPLDESDPEPESVLDPEPVRAGDPVTTTETDTQEGE